MKSRFVHWIILSLLVKSFSADAQQFCATPPASSEQIRQMQDAQMQYRAMAKKMRVAAGPVTYLPLKVHFVRNSDGSGGAQVSNLMTALSGLNKQFLPAGIQFYMAGSAPNLINNSSLYNFDWINNYDALVTANRTPTAANLFVVNTLTLNGSDYGAIGGDNVVVTIPSLIPAIVTHEFGHHFSLFHPFGNGQELVSGTNCASVTDFICDTPADPWDLPGGGNTDDGTCIYKGGLTDAQGQPYQPMMDNVMSGWQCSRTAAARFTTGQQQVMAASLANWLQNPTPARTYTYPPDAVAAPTSLSVLKSSGKAQITWQDNSANEAGFFIERAVGTPENFNAIGGVAPNVTTFTDAGIISSTVYYYRIRPANTSTGAFSSVFAFNSGLIYCSPRYFSPYPNPPASGNVGIDDVVLQTSANAVILSNTGSGFASGSYSDYSSAIASATLASGQSYSLTLKGKFETLSQANVAVWIDYNRDGVFGTTERVLAPVQKLVSGSTLTASFTVPTSITAGSTYMRIRIATLVPPDPTEVNDPCALLFGKGEAEDYAITLRLPAISVGTIPTVCAGTQLSVPFSITGLFGVGNTFKVQLSNASGSNFIDLPTSGTASSLTVTIPANTTAGTGYRVQIVSSNPVITSLPSAAFRINSKATASISGSTSINSGQSTPLTISLSGSSPWSLTISSSTGEISAFTMPIPAFNLYVAPQQTTTYQIAQVSNTCGTGITTGTATVTVKIPCTVATASLTGSSTIIEGQKATLSTAFTGTAPYNFTLSNGQSFTNIAQSPFSFTVSPFQTTTYTVVRVSNLCGTGTVSGSATVVVNPSCPGLTASIAGSTTIDSGQSTPLAISMSGSGPRSLTIVASTGEISAFTMPISSFYLYVAPGQTTTYQISRVRAACGTGTTSGTAVVTVRTPNGRISSPALPAFFISEVLLSDSSKLLTENPMDEYRAEKNLLVYPNPTAGEITVQYRTLDDGPVKLQVAGLTGTVVKVLLDKAGSTAGEHTDRFQLAELPAGQYVIVLKQNAVVESQKILIIR